jgi:hypothetical protein
MGEGSRLQGSRNSLHTSEVVVAQRFLAPRISCGTWWRRRTSCAFP